MVKDGYVDVTKVGEIPVLYEVSVVKVKVVTRAKFHDSATINPSSTRVSGKISRRNRPTPDTGR